jgi:hypothetical protein
MENYKIIQQEQAFFISTKAIIKNSTTFPSFTK